MWDLAVLIGTLRFVLQCPPKPYGEDWDPVNWVADNWKLLYYKSNNGSAVGNGQGSACCV